MAITRGIAYKHYQIKDILINSIVGNNIQISIVTDHFTLKNLSTPFIDALHSKILNSACIKEKAQSLWGFVVRSIDDHEKMLNAVKIKSI